MEKEQRRKLYKQAIKNWGAVNQVFMVMEETGEMLNALAKVNRNRSTNHEVITEVVDVWILMEQMAEIFGWEEFEKELDFKLERLKGRLEQKESLIK